MTRLFAYLILAVLTVALAIGGCSSDEDTPLGSSFLADSLIISDPGDVFTDTVDVTGDFSVVVNAFATKSDRMSIGSKSGVLSSIVIRFDLTAADTNKTVTRAVLSLREVGDSPTKIAALFYELQDTVGVDDPVPSLVLGDVIPDSTGVNTSRTMQVFPSSFALSPAVVQPWVQQRAHTGIAIVIDEPDSAKSLLFGTAENGASTKRPFLTLTYSDASEQSFLSPDIIVDGTFFTDTNVSPPNSNAIADGEVRRIFFPMDLSDFDTRLFLHDATLTVYFDSLAGIPGSETIVLYTPESTDPDDPGFLKGTQVSVIDAATTQCLTSPPYDATAECEVRIRFPIREAVQRFLIDPAAEHGFVLRYTLEGSDPRRMEFFSGTAADFVRPTYTVIFSTPAEFPLSR